MTDDTQDTSTSEQQPPAWEPKQYEAALAHLEQLQEQLDGLRSTIPSIITPLVRPATSKEQMFADVRKSAIQSSDNMKQFRETWNSEQTQQLFARNKESLEKDGDLTRSREVARYGWSEERQ